jgi:hypothetical protein
MPPEETAGILKTPDGGPLTLKAIATLLMACLDKAFCHLSFVICHLSFFICHLSVVEEGAQRS